MSYIESVNHALLNEIEYESYNGTKKALALYNYLDRGSKRGDTVAHAILVDLNTAIYSGILSEKQLEAVELFFIYLMTYEGIANLLNISKQSAIERVAWAVRKIRRILLSGELYKR